VANRRLTLWSTPLLAVGICAAFVFATPALSPGQGGGGSPDLEEVDGGRDYYARFSNSLPARSEYFPIGAWLRPASESRHFASYADFGMNVFVGVESPEPTDEAMIRQAGMQTFVQSDERSRFDDIGSENAGHMIGDEIDMCCGPPDFAGGNGYQMLADTLAGLPQDGKARFANYGKGVMFWESDQDAQRFVNEFQDIVSNDIYWFTDPNERDRPGYGVAASYGATVDRMRHLDSLDGQRKPIWNVVELGWPFTESAAAGGRRILPDELRAAVWHSIIAGARGIIYFDHNFGPGSPGSTILGDGYQDTRAMAISVNRQIEHLAPVLNAPTVTSGWTSNPPIRAMVKWQGGHFYVFAGSRNNVSSTGTVSIPCVGDATAVRLGEAGHVPVSGGAFSDSFADGNAVHIYRIDGGSTCGLGHEPTSEPAPPPPPPADPFAAQYFDNRELSGAPVLARNDDAIDFDWGGGTPGDGVPADNFSARWTRTKAYAEGTYRFAVTGDDGIRVLVDGAEVIDGWFYQAPTTYTADVPLSEGQHTVVVEYFEHTGGAVARFGESKLADSQP
jgi:PA14 domain